MKVKKAISIVFYILFILMMLFVIAVSIGNPLNNLIPKQMVLIATLFMLVVLAGCFAWQKIYKKIRKYEPFVYAAILVCFGTLLYLLSYKQIPNAAALMGDYHKVFHTAESYVFGGIIEFHPYFLNYGNNIAPMLLLAFLFRVSTFLHINKELFLMGIVCIRVVCTVRSMGYLLEDGENKAWRIPVAVVFFAWLPLWGTSYAFYTDTMSMGLCVIAIAIIKYINIVYVKNGNRASFSTVLLSVLSAFLVVITMKWKITGTIPIIAYFCVSFFKSDKLKIKKWIPFLLALGAVYVLLSTYINSFEITKKSKSTSDPIISWVALGLKGDGTWTYNCEFAEYEHTLPNKEAKKQYVYEYIADNWKEAFSFEHIYYKTRANFADGNMRARDYTTFFDDGSVYWDLFNPNGKYLWRVSQYDFCYLIMVYVFLLAGAVNNLLKLVKKNEESEIAYIAHLTFFGAAVFLMIWESNTRQLYNIMPMLFVGSFCFVKSFVEKIELIISKRKTL